MRRPYLSAADLNNWGRHLLRPKRMVYTRKVQVIRRVGLIGDLHAEHEALAFVLGDGGSGVFPLGVRGVWDTYTFVPCLDGGTGETCTPEPDGGPGHRLTHILHPRDCDRDLASGWDSGSAGSDR